MTSFTSSFGSWLYALQDRHRFCKKDSSWLRALKHRSRFCKNETGHTCAKSNSCEETSFTPSSCSWLRTTSQAAGDVGRSIVFPSEMSRPLAPRCLGSSLCSEKARTAADPRARLCRQVRASPGLAIGDKHQAMPCCASN